MFLTQVQQAVTRHLSSQPFFSGGDGVLPIPVIAGNDKGLAGKAAAAMGKLGLCIIVVPLGGDFSQQNIDIPYLTGKFTCRVRENQMVNRGSSGTGQPGDYIAEVAALILHNHQPQTPEGSALGGGGIKLEAIASGEDEPGISAWDLIFSYDGGVSHEAVRLDFSTAPLP